MSTHFSIVRHSLLALAVAGVLAVSPAMASKGGERHQPLPNAERMAERLSLDPAQRETIAALFAEHRQLMQQISWRNEDGSPNREARSEARAARELLKASVREVLDPAQAEQFESMSSRWQQRGARHGQGRHDRHRGPARMWGQLDLSEQQQAEIASLMQEHRQGNRQQRQELRQSIHAVLTEEQRAQMQSQREQRRQRGAASKD